MIKDFFERLQEIHNQYGQIPPEQIWNMDEKGIQMGGGRGNISKKYSYLRARKNRYKMKSDNLELVTVLECVSAAGVSIPTSFVLKNGPMPDIRGVDNVGR